MEKIALPQKIKFEKGEKPNQEIVTIEPCYPGYGTTLGNSLRRVLLSSLPGAAVVGVKIKGADHEFMTLPHVKEDMLEVIMNLKLLRFKMHTEGIVKLELDAHGEKTVTAADIEKNSELEVINTDQVIANITDMAGNLKMDIYVSNGRGYETIESREKIKHEVGYIEIDSPYSPIMSVGINIENARVGKMTNWDKLILDILTDGTITAEKAFEDSVKILIEQFSALLGVQPVEEVKEVEEIVEEVKDLKDIVLDEDEIGGDEKKRRGRPKKS